MRRPITINDNKNNGKRRSNVISHCGTNATEGTITMGTVVRWFGGLARGARQRRDPAMVMGKRHTQELKFGIGMARR